MNKRTPLFLLCIGVALLGGCGYGFNDGKLTLDFSAEQIQNAIAPKFPVENCPVMLTCIKLQNPKVTLLENSDRITLGFDSTVTLLQQPIAGTAVVSAKPRFQNSTGQIFLEDTRIQDFKMQGVSANVTTLITQYGSALAQLALQTTPIYSFKNAQAEKIAKMGISEVKVVDGKLRVVFDPTLAQAAK
jgi:Protein of unknown function (DUF1439)